MQLTYRGVTYQQPLSQVQLPTSTQTGKYRGQTVSITPAVRVLRQSLIALTYRGVNYTHYTVSYQSQLIDTSAIKSTEDFNF